MSTMLKHFKSLTMRILHFFLYYLRKRIKIKLPHRVYGDARYHTFIGYYDVQPFDKEEKSFLAGRVPHTHSGRAMDVSLELGIMNLENGEFNTFDKTPLWSWQQGCRLQWQIYKEKNLIAYNTLTQDRAVCSLYDPDSQKRAYQLPFPVYCFSRNGDLAATLDFNYLELCRPGYGYDLGHEHDSNTYIRLYDTENLELRMELRIVDILPVNTHPSMKEETARHYFNHLHFNPSANRLMVFHIWEVGGRRRVRALTMNVDGSNIRDVTGGIHVSHYWWLDDDRLLFYGTDPASGIGYHIYNQDGSGLIETLDRDIPQIDGHPSSHPDNSGLILSDTVQDRLFRRGLWLYNIANKKRTDIGYLHSVATMKGQHRCDLHPRWSPAGRYVAIDSAHNCYRQIVMLETLCNG